MKALACLLVLTCCACGTVEQRPAEVRTNTVTISVPVAVPCFVESDRPVMPTPTPIDPETASTEQLAAAELADALALADFAKTVDALFTQCSKGAP